MKKVQLEITVEQADVVVKALDLYNRITLGQLEEVSRVLDRQTNFFKGDYTLRNEAESSLRDIKESLGFNRNGSYGIGNPACSLANSRSYEILKILQLAIAIDREPNPSFKNVDYDGLTLRYTQDPLPLVKIINRRK